MKKWTIRRSGWNCGQGIVHHQTDHLLIHISAATITAPRKICSYICMLSLHWRLLSSLLLWSSLLGVLWSSRSITPIHHLRLTSEKSDASLKCSIHGKRPAGFLHDYLFALPAVDFAACFFQLGASCHIRRLAGLKPRVGLQPLAGCTSRNALWALVFLLVWCFQGPQHSREEGTVLELPGNTPQGSWTGNCLENLPLQTPSFCIWECLF